MTSPPSGMAPPASAVLGSRSVDLTALAVRICERYRELYPDEDERYGAETAVAWCRHDNQHILNWAIGAAAGLVDLDREIDWLAGVLDARDFPLDRLARGIELAADELDAAEGAAAAPAVDALRRNAGRVRER